MKQHVMQVGNSLGVTVPSDFVKSVGIKAGDFVEVETRIDSNKVIYKFSGVKQLLIAGNLLNFKKTKK